jgi:hypothetical protein
VKSIADLRATVIHLVETSPAGQAHEELQNLLHLRVHDTLRFLAGARALQRSDQRQWQKSRRVAGF